MVTGMRGAERAPPASHAQRRPSQAQAPARARATRRAAGLHAQGLLPLVPHGEAAWREGSWHGTASRVRASSARLLVLKNSCERRSTRVRL